MMRRSPLGNTKPKPKALRVADGRARMELPSAVCACGRKYVKLNSMQGKCIPCLRQVGPKLRKEEAAKTRAQKEALKTKPQLLEEAQVAFRAWVRARDFGKPCICCGRYPQSGEALTGGQWDGGHYRSRGACPELAFDERNCHAQLKRCNGNAWDVAAYRANLIERIGLAEVEDVEGPHPMPKWSRDDLREMRDRYRRLEKELTKRNREQIEGQAA